MPEGVGKSKIGYGTILDIRHGTSNVNRAQVPGKESSCCHQTIKHTQELEGTRTRQAACFPSADVLMH